ncbi:MAG: dihydrofolate reductase [Pseudomonadota bacterium]|nr:dihydrofolate reductase [Pseudomonadota bacterium]
MTPTLCLICAMARNRVIGRNGDLPWQLPADLRHFKSVTMGKPIIMGRKTFESIGRPLPGRKNIVVTRRANFVSDGVLISNNLTAAIALGKAIASEDNVDEIMVIGGGEIYAKALSDADRLYLTEVHADIDGDTFFPALDRGLWREKSRNSHAADGDKPGFDFILLER